MTIYFASCFYYLMRVKREFILTNSTNLIRVPSVDDGEIMNSGDYLCLIFMTRIGSMYDIITVDRYHAFS